MESSFDNYRYIRRVSDKFNSPDQVINDYQYTISQINEWGHSDPKQLTTEFFKLLTNFGLHIRRVDIFRVDPGVRWISPYHFDGPKDFGDHDPWPSRGKLNFVMGHADLEMTWFDVKEGRDKHPDEINDATITKVDSANNSRPVGRVINHYKDTSVDEVCRSKIKGITLVDVGMPHNLEAGFPIRTEIISLAFNVSKTDKTWIPLAELNNRIDIPTLVEFFEKNTNG